jgi:AraC family transcriptional regulator
MQEPRIASGRDYVQAAIDLVEHAIHEHQTLPSVQELAGRIGYSVHHFSRLFSAIAGQSPSSYINDRVLGSALSAIRSGDRTLAAIAADAGFANYEVFSRAFRRKFGISPRAARQDPGRLLISVPELVLPALVPGRALASPLPEIVEESAACLAGMWFHIDGSERGFHRQWAIFMAQAGRLDGVRQPRRWYQDAVWGPGGSGDAAAANMNILCALEIELAAAEAQDPYFSVRRLPAGRCLRFLHTGRIDEIADSYRYIYGEYLARSGLRLGPAWEFQRFGDQAEGSGLEICLPLAGG